MVGGSARSSAPGASFRCANICSAKSGLPPARSRSRARRLVSSGASLSRSISCSDSSSVSGSSTIERALRPRPASSTNSGRARQTSRTGASLVHSVRCSIMSSIVASAQWTSSKQTTSGLSRASDSQSLRTAQKLSSVRAVASPPTAPRMLSTTAARSSSALSSSSSCSLGSSPASSRMISTSGQNVIPSP